MIPGVILYNYFVIQEKKSEDINLDMVLNTNWREQIVQRMKTVWIWILLDLDSLSAVNIYFSVLNKLQVTQTRFIQIAENFCEKVVLSWNTKGSWFKK